MIKFIRVKLEDGAVVDCIFDDSVSSDVLRYSEWQEMTGIQTDYEDLKKEMNVGSTIEKSGSDSDSNS